MSDVVKEKGGKSLIGTEPKASSCGSALTLLMFFLFILQVRWWRPITCDHWV